MSLLEVLYTSVLVGIYTDRYDHVTFVHGFVQGLWLLEAGLVESDDQLMPFVLR